MKKRIARIAGAVLGVSVLLGGAGLGVVLWHVHQSVQQYRKVAQAAHPHPGDDVAALIDFMKSDSHPLPDRNLAIWTLGHLRDARALPALESVYTGKPCAHDKYLCQYELEKAIRLCGGIPNPPRQSKH